MNRRMTCILCPNGCKLKMDVSDLEIRSLHGARCPRGILFAKQEIHDPQRNIATSVLVKNGELPLVSVRLTRAVPKDRIWEVLSEIRRIRAEAPVYSGDILIHNVSGIVGADVICTRNVNRI